MQGRREANSVNTKADPPVILFPTALLNIFCLCFLFEANFYFMSQRHVSWREHESFERLISDEGGTLSFSLCPQILNSHLGVPASPALLGNKDALETVK